MSELDAARREALTRALWDCDPLALDNMRSEWARMIAADALAPLIAQWLAEAEQRGREDNADHGMCYVHGSRALEARLAEAKGEALREAADWCEVVVKDAMGAIRSDYANGWHEASAQMLAEIRDRAGASGQEGEW